MCLAVVCVEAGFLKSGHIYSFVPTRIKILVILYIIFFVLRLDELRKEFVNKNETLFEEHSTKLER